MEWVTYIVLGGFFIFATVCILITLFGLPGGWIMLTVALVIELSDSLWGGGYTWGWIALGICGGLLVIGELIELLASALGVKVGGGSRRGMIGSIIGGIVGGILFTFTPIIPIPVIGTLIGAIIGTFVGAIVGEVTLQDAPSAKQVATSATGATIGRILGVIGKTGIAAICWCILVISPFL